MLSTRLAATQRNPFPMEGSCLEGGVCVHISAFTMCASVCVCTQVPVCVCVPGSMHTSVRVSPAGALGTRGLHVVPLFGAGCGSVSVLWMLEQSQAGVDTQLSTRSGEGMWAPGGQP